MHISIFKAFYFYFIKLIFYPAMEFQHFNFQLKMRKKTLNKVMISSDYKQFALMLLHPLWCPWILHV